MKTFVWVAIAVAALMVWSGKGNSDLTQEELLNNKAKISAELATVKTDTVNVISPDTIPDLQNCDLCDGTGYITHADGHKTPCPYHGSQVQLEELQDKFMTLSEKMAVQQKYGEDLYTYLLDQQEKQKLIIKPEPQKAPIPDKQLKKTSCPCGCRHDVVNCNCRASCPGKQLPAYTYVTAKKPIIQRREITVTQPLPPVVKEQTIEKKTTVLTPYPSSELRQTTTTYSSNIPRIARFRSRTKSCGIFGCNSSRRGYIGWRRN